LRVITADEATQKALINVIPADAGIHEVDRLGSIPKISSQTYRLRKKSQTTSFRRMPESMRLIDKAAPQECNSGC
jgi:hypothetical protein